MPQEPKRPVSELKPAELKTIVGNIQKLLWLDNEEGDGPEFWNAEKEWECADLLSFIATELENAGLKPIDPPTVIGFDSIDEFLEALPAGQWGETHVYLQYANGASASLAQCWRSDAPRREAHHDSMSTAKPILLAELVDGKEPEYGEAERHVLKADPPDEIASWDVWAEELSIVRELLLNVGKRAEVLERGYF